MHLIEFVELGDGHDLHGGHAERLQVRNLLAQPEERAGVLDARTGMARACWSPVFGST